MGQHLSFSAWLNSFCNYPLRPPGREEKKTRRGQPGGASSIFPLGLIPSIIIPCALRAGQARGLLWETCGFPPRPLLATSPGIPLPFQSRAPPHPPGVLVFQQKLRFRNTRTCRHGIAWRGDQTKRFVFTLPAVPPGRGVGVSQVVPAPRQSLRRRDGVRTKGELPCPDFMPPRIRGWMCAPACSESEALVGTGGQ